MVIFGSAFVVVSEVLARLCYEARVGLRYTLHGAAPQRERVALKAHLGLLQAGIDDVLYCPQQLAIKRVELCEAVCCAVNCRSAYGGANLITVRTGITLEESNRPIISLVNSYSVGRPITLTKYFRV